MGMKQNVRLNFAKKDLAFNYYLVIIIRIIFTIIIVFIPHQLPSTFQIQHIACMFERIAVVH